VESDLVRVNWCFIIISLEIQFIRNVRRRKMSEEEEIPDLLENLNTYIYNRLYSEHQPKNPILEQIILEQVIKRIEEA
jgi:hypothetical protein